jgi:hypothetical protein
MEGLEESSRTKTEPLHSDDQERSVELLRAAPPAVLEVLGANPYGHQFGVAMRILHGLDRIFGSESAHHQGQLAIGCRLDGQPINAQDILRSVRATAVHFNHKLDVFHHFGVPSYCSIGQAPRLASPPTRILD